MDVSLFSYPLPKNLIADYPSVPRDSSKLLVINRNNGEFTHKHFYNLPEFLDKNSVLVLNKTKVFPARVFGHKNTGGKIEVLLIDEVSNGHWKALTKPGLKNGQWIKVFKDKIFKFVKHEGQTSVLETDMDRVELLEHLSTYGHTPLPPYIHSKNKESTLRKTYQTVYAKETGSVAAPTAGFHFTDELLEKIQKMGVQIEYVTLHVGLGTFTPIKTDKLEDHIMHFEYYKVEKETADQLNNAKKANKRIVAVGTTTARVLETLAEDSPQLDTSKLSGNTNLFIYPPRKFNFVNSLITNFHLPQSTLLAMVSAFVSFPNTNEEFKDFKTSLAGKAYMEAIKQNYRFYSFGDASLII